MKRQNDSETQAIVMRSKVPSSSNDTEQFLLAAKRAETQSLDTLLRTCEVVTEVGELIHHLQRERGLSNVYLASPQHFLQNKRSHQVEQSQQSEADLRRLLKGNYLTRQIGPSATSRLLSCVAFVLEGLGELDRLRNQIQTLNADAAYATRTYSDLIAGLLSIVFEAADSSGDPALSRALIALFNFMQCKEYCGQERAWGAIGFAEGGFSQSDTERLHNLQLAQQRCAALFCQFSSDSSSNKWNDIETQSCSRELQRLREMIDQSDPGESLPSQLSEIWYEVATQRIDAMHQLELSLLQDLSHLSHTRLEAARQSLRDHEVKLLNGSGHPRHSTSLHEPGTGHLSWQIQVPSTTPYSNESDGGAPVSRSVYELLKQQADHLEKTQRELHEAKQALTERKLVEQAKGLLMKNLNLSEEAAFRKIQKRAMESNLKLIEVSELIINTAKKRATKPHNG